MNLHDFVGDREPKLHIFVEQVTPEFLVEARAIVRKVFGEDECTLVVHNFLDEVIYEEVITNEKEREKVAQKTQEAEKATEA